MPLEMIETSRVRRCEVDRPVAHIRNLQSRLASAAAALDVQRMPWPLTSAALREIDALKFHKVSRSGGCETISSGTTKTISRTKSRTARPGEMSLSTIDGARASNDMRQLSKALQHACAMNLCDSNAATKD